MDHGFGYGDFSPHTHELIGLQAGMEMLGIPSKSPEATWQHQQWTPQQNPNPNRMMAEDDVFPIQHASEGLSLSLYNPAAAGAVLQPFHHPISAGGRETKFYNFQQDGTYCESLPKSCRYLVAAQQLLNEFCSLNGGGGGSGNTKHRKSGDGSSSFSSYNHSLNSLDLPELQKRKSRLISMLEEVDRRYRKYCEQMRAVVSSFESVAGEGAASVYSNLASKAMSRHFRCMRDGIVGQIKATKKVMGEKDPVGAGSSRGETPRLKMLDQSIRQQKAFQQGGMMESHPWRPQRGLPERAVTVLRSWLFEHFLHPYPSDVDKHILARQTGLSRSQVSNWFINARVRLWKPMVEEMYVEETKEQDNNSQYNSPHASLGHDDSGSGGSRPIQLLSNPNPNPGDSQLFEDQKPSPGQLLLHDSDSLSSIVNSRHRYEVNQQQMVDMDFSAYNDCGSASQSFGSGVSLTLGLQQHSGGGMSLSFSPTAQNSLYFGSRESMDDCQPVQYPIMDGDQAQNLPYRNLMGGQLLHDLAG